MKIVCIFGLPSILHMDTFDIFEKSSYHLHLPPTQDAGSSPPELCSIFSLRDPNLKTYKSWGGGGRSKLHSVKQTIQTVN